MGQWDYVKVDLDLNRVYGSGLWLKHISSSLSAFYLFSRVGCTSICKHDLMFSRFDPDRFARTDNGMFKQKHPPLAYCPFGFAGRRLCPGKLYFFDEAMMYLATLIRRFEFRLSDKTRRDMPINNGLLTRPHDDVILTIHKRWQRHTIRLQE